MYSPFTQRIGIWYTQEDKSMMINIMQHIEKWVGDSKAMYISKDKYSIFLKDGSWIKAFPLDTQQRGQRLTTSFVIHPEKCSKELIDSVVRACTTLSNGCVCEINSDDAKALEQQLYYRIFI